jgi:hypothetical protein
VTSGRAEGKLSLGLIGPGDSDLLKTWIFRNGDDCRTKFRMGVRWQRDFFDHRLRNHRELDEKTCYVLQNPVRKNLAARVEDWPWVYRPMDR